MSLSETKVDAEEEKYKNFNDHSEIYDSETLEYLKEEFTRLEDNCYLDHAGATLYSKTQMKNIFDDFGSNVYGNPHSIGIASKQSLDVIDQIRFRILDHFHTNSEEYSVIFTSSATDCLKILSNSFKFSPNEADNSSCNFVYLKESHTSVLGMREVFFKKGVRIHSVGHEDAFRIFRDELGKSNTDNANGVPKSNGNDLNSLFVYPAQCNFTGLKYPLSWLNIAKANPTLDSITKGDRSTNWFTLLDAASYVPTNDLNLDIYRPDFVCLSFYKMFGYPTGLGALLVKKSAEFTLEKVYYGGGTVDVTLSSELFHSKRSVLHERFEDGTVSFLSIISLRHGFDALSKIPIEKISNHVFSLARYFHHCLLISHHSNGRPLANLYGDTDYEDPEKQGGTVSFNLLRPNGRNVGFIEFLNVANLNKIHVRTGCSCNPGACQRHLNLSDAEIKRHFNSGHVCGDERDLIGGKPTGAIRVSFGYMSTVADVDSLLSVIEKSFVDEPVIKKIPKWWSGFKNGVEKKYGGRDDGDESRVFDDAEAGGDRDGIDADVEIVEERLTSPDVVSTFGKKCLKLKRLFIYPVKSCGSYEISESWIIGEKGLAYDREWMITTASGVCLTQKQEIKLCLIKPTINRAENLLELSYPGMPPVRMPLKISPKEKKGGIICTSKVCGHKVEGIDCGSDVSEWLSLALGRPGLRLIKQNESKTGPVKKSPEISFSSQAQYLLINESSIGWLAERIPTNSGCDKNTISDRFRGNIIIGGSNEPFQEMTWTNLRIGKIEFQVDSQCTRCQMICIDQTTGKKTVEPLRTLAEEFQGKMRFGIYLSKKNGGNGYLKIGDDVLYE